MDTIVGNSEVLISLGRHSDEVLDLLQLPDTILPSLHQLITTFRSNRWISVLEGPKFALSHEKAVLLASALLEDSKAAKVVRKVNIYMLSRYLSVTTINLLTSCRNASASAPTSLTDSEGRCFMTNSTTYSTVFILDITRVRPLNERSIAEALNSEVQRME